MAQEVNSDQGIQEWVPYHTKQCYACGKPSTVRVTPSQYLELIARDADPVMVNGIRVGFKGRFIQEIFPGATPSYRELVKSGIHPQCWAELMEDDDFRDNPDAVNEEGEPLGHMICIPCTTAAGYPPDHAIRVRTIGFAVSQGPGMGGNGHVECTFLECGHDLIADTSYLES